MTVTQCSIHRKRSTIGNRDSTHSVWYFITTDNANDDLTEVYLSAQTVGPNPLPAAGERHPNDLTTFVQSIDLDHRHENDFKHWVAAVQYGPPPQDSEQENPFDWDITYQLEFKLVSRPVTKDAFGNPLVNTARDPVVNPPRDNVRVPVLVANKNFATLQEMIVLGEAFDRTSNDSTWFGAPPGVAKFESIRAGRLQTFNDVDYYPATISVAIEYQDNEDGLTFVDNLGWQAWDILPGWSNRGTEVTDPDGTIYLKIDSTDWAASPDSATAEKSHIIGDDSQPITAPIYLDRDGRKPSKADAIDPVHRLAFDLRRRVDYTQLGIGG